VHKTIERKGDNIAESLFALVRKSLAQPIHVVVVVLVEVVVAVLRMTDMNWFSGSSCEPAAHMYLPTVALLDAADLHIEMFALQIGGGGGGGAGSC